MFRYNTIVQTSSIFEENTARGTRLRNPNEESSLVANTKLTETILAKLWAVFYLSLVVTKGHIYIKENVRNFQKLK